MLNLALALFCSILTSSHSEIHVGEIVAAPGYCVTLDKTSNQVRFYRIGEKPTYRLSFIRSIKMDGRILGGTTKDLHYELITINSEGQASLVDTTLRGTIMATRLITSLPLTSREISASRLYQNERGQQFLSIKRRGMSAESAKQCFAIKGNSFELSKSFGLYFVAGLGSIGTLKSDDPSSSGPSYDRFTLWLKEPFQRKPVHFLVPNDDFDHFRPYLIPATIDGNHLELPFLVWSNQGKRWRLAYLTSGINHNPIFRTTRLSDYTLATSEDSKVVLLGRDKVLRFQIDGSLILDRLFSNK